MSVTQAVSSSGDTPASSGEVVSLKISNLKYTTTVTPDRRRKHYVKLLVGANSQKTKSVRMSMENSVLWHDALPISVTTGTVITLKVFVDPTVGRDELVAQGNMTLSLLKKEEDVVLDLTAMKSNERLLTATSTIGFKITPDNAGPGGSTTTPQHESIENETDPSSGDLKGPSSSETQPAPSEQNLDTAVEEANRQVVHVQTGSQPLLDAVLSATASGGDGVGGDVGQIGKSLESLLGHVEAFMTIMDTVSEIHPYVKMMWSVLTVACKAIKGQREVDKSVVDLTQQMNDMYELVNAADPLKKVQGNEGQMKVLAAMAQQTLECAYFIREYCTDASLVKRTFKHLGSSAKKSISDYSMTLSRLQAAFVDQSAVKTQISVTRIMDIVDDITPRIEAAFNMIDMPYAAGAGLDSEKKCLEGTRVKIIEEICLWASGAEHDEKNVLLLTGFAGAGKSTIAHAVADRFRTSKRLGSMFCFNRAKATERHPGSIFTTITQDIADLDPEWRRLLSAHIQTREARTTPFPDVQFKLFFLSPSDDLLDQHTNLCTVGPIVIVIDALDESGDLESRKSLIRILATETAKLPSNFRIFITARAEEDIEAAFRGKSHVRYLRLDDIESTDEDIEVFVRDRLNKLKGKPEFEGDVKWLAKNAERLFQWANAACLYIVGERGADPVNRLKSLKLAVSRNETLVRLNNLDSLYDGILSMTFNLKDEEVRERFTTVMGWIIAAREPLSKSSLQELGDRSGADPTGNAVGLIIPSLGSLLSGVHDEGLPVVPLHTSFRDFLQTHYCRDISRQNAELAIGTLQVMTNSLRFNICGLESSHVPNTAVADLGERIKKFVGIPLSYACRFWAVHLSQVKYDTDLASNVQSALMCDRVLYWLEVLSLIRRVPDARRLLDSAIQWLSENDTDLRAFIADASRFVGVFGGAIARSAPHIYVSALPFTPSASPLSQTLLPMSTNRLVITTGQLVDWPVVELVMEGHTGRVTTMAFSHDGRYIASGSEDCTVRVWDAITGETVAGPLHGHTSIVKSVMFSPDGTHVVSGSWDGALRDGTMRLWNVETGEM